MIAKVSIDDSTFERLQKNGELHVENSHGETLVLRTSGALDQLGKVICDDGEWTPEEMMGVLADQVDDPEGMGASGMESYDKKYGHLFDDNGKDQ